MQYTHSERRLVENQVVFRQLNRQIHTGIEETNKLAAEDDQKEFIISTDQETEPLYFFCECSDETCGERLQMTYQEYEQIHKDNRQFVVKLGHEIPLIEDVISKAKHYEIVRKKGPVPKTVKHPNPTSFKNPQ